jgi:hypothetical protein
MRFLCRAVASVLAEDLSSDQRWMSSRNAVAWQTMRHSFVRLIDNSRSVRCGDSTLSQEQVRSKPNHDTVLRHVTMVSLSVRSSHASRQQAGAPPPSDRAP